MTTRRVAMSHGEQALAEDLASARKTIENLEAGIRQEREWRQQADELTKAAQRERQELQTHLKQLDQRVDQAEQRVAGAEASERIMALQLERARGFIEALKGAPAPDLLGDGLKVNSPGPERHAMRNLEERAYPAGRR